MTNLTERRAKLRIVQVALRRAWDPIGVLDIEEAVDEYDSYALSVLGMLDRGASNDEIADYLTSVERDRMGLTPEPGRNENIAAMLSELCDATC